MATAVESPHRAADRQWFIVSRWQEYEGEGRANLLRIIGVAAFYAVELYYFYVQLSPDQRAGNRLFHLAITMLSLAWTMVSLGVLLCRKNYFFPGSLKFISTGCDFVLLTAMIALANGTNSPLVVVYFLIIALSCLRFSLPLVWFTTAGAMASYVFLIGHAYWWYMTQDDDSKRVDRHHQIIFLLALLLTGVVVGQVIRRVRGLAEEYVRRQGQPTANS